MTLINIDPVSTGLTEKRRSRDILPFLFLAKYRKMP